MEEVLDREVVDVTRVTVERYVDAPSPPREEGDSIIVPLYEEVLVIEKRLRLREEVHLTRRKEQRSETHRVRLRSEEADVERTEIEAGTGTERTGTERSETEEA